MQSQYFTRLAATQSGQTIEATRPAVFRTMRLRIAAAHSLGRCGAGCAKTPRLEKQVAQRPKASAAITLRAKAGHHADIDERGDQLDKRLGDDNGGQQRDRARHCKRQRQYH